MKKIGLLYTKNDSFGGERSELLVGPMKLEGVRFIRFINLDINDNLLVSGEEYINSNWEKTKPLKLDSILNFTKQYSKVTLLEKELLEKTPSSSKLNLNSYEFFKILEESNIFNNELLKSQILNNFNDINLFLEKNNKIVLKPLFKIDENIYIIQKENKKWLINQNYSSYYLSDIQFKEFIKNCVKNYFIQEFIESKTKDNTYISFDLITQQRYDKSWIAPIVRAVSSKEIFASLKSGGEFIGAPILNKDIQYFDFTELKVNPNLLNLRMQSLIVCIAEYIQKKLESNFSTLKVSLLLDEQLNPKISSISLNTYAQSSPGRHMEFYKNLTEFAIGLSENKQVIKSNKKTLLNKQINIPKEGITVRNSISENEYKDFTNSLLWIDFSLGHGGRKLIDFLTNHYYQKNDRPFLSLRVGHALNDIKNVKRKKENIIAIEEYLGKGILNWNESKHMRSVRLPLIEKQYKQSKDYFINGGLDLLWLEDADIGFQALNGNLELTLKEIIDFFEKLKKQKEIHYWGITLFNPKSTYSLKILNTLKKIDIDMPSFKFIGIRMKKLDLITLNLLLNMNINVVIFSDEITINDIDISLHNKVTVLKTYKKLVN